MGLVLCTVYRSVFNSFIPLFLSQAQGLPRVKLTLAHSSSESNEFSLPVFQHIGARI